ERGGVMAVASGLAGGRWPRIARGGRVTVSRPGLIARARPRVRPIRAHHTPRAPSQGACSTLAGGRRPRIAPSARLMVATSALADERRPLTPASVRLI